VACKHYNFIKVCKFSDSSRAEQWQGLCNTTPELEKLKQDYQDLFSSVSQPIERDVRKFINSFNVNVLKYADFSPVEELSEIVQNFYQVFAKRMEASSIYTGNTTILLIQSMHRIFDFFPVHLMLQYFTIRNVTVEM
jgi:hypothetical protein